MSCEHRYPGKNGNCVAMDGGGCNCGGEVTAECLSLEREGARSNKPVEVVVLDNSPYARCQGKSIVGRTASFGGDIL